MPAPGRRVRIRRIKPPFCKPKPPPWPPTPWPPPILSTDLLVHIHYVQLLLYPMDLATEIRCPHWPPGSTTNWQGVKVVGPYTATVIIQYNPATALGAARADISEIGAAHPSCYTGWQAWPNWPGLVVTTAAGPPPTGATCQFFIVPDYAPG